MELSGPTFSRVMKVGNTTVDIFFLFMKNWNPCLSLVSAAAISELGPHHVALNVMITYQVSHQNQTSLRNGAQNTYLLPWAHTVTLST
jgi:hypothetical protein